MLAQLSEKVGIEFDDVVLGGANGPSEENLLEFSRRIAEGEYDFGWMWGLEYGWVSERGSLPDLEPLVCADKGLKGADGWGYLLVVNKEQGHKSLQDLKGKRLAEFDTASVLHQRTLEYMVAKVGGRHPGYFAASSKYSSGKRALLAVARGEETCVLISNAEYSFLVLDNPRIGERVAVIHPKLACTPINLPPVAVARRQHLEQVRKGLWSQLQQTFVKLDSETRGKECVRFWKIRRFVPPIEGFREFAAATLREQFQGAPLTTLAAPAP